MLTISKHNPRKWLTLLFIAGFLFNIQASYACMMMPDMAAEKSECCCGSDHRMPDMPDMDHGEHVAHDYDETRDLDSNICDDPLRKCCIVEVSVGINDPPSDEVSSATSTQLKAPAKPIKLFDSPFPVSHFIQVESLLARQNHLYVARPPDPVLGIPVTPLYKTTERYRI